MDTNTNNSLLIVDDDKAYLFELIHILRPEYKLYSAKEGISALKVAEENIPDLILLDIVLPGMSGYEVLAELRKSDKTKNIPVIFITGISEADDEYMGLNMGAVDYIQKPFNHKVVLNRVRQQIDIINLRRELAECARLKNEECNK